MSPRETHDIFRVKTKIDKIFYLLSGTSVSFMGERSVDSAISKYRTWQIKTRGRRIGTKPNWTKISVLSYYVWTIADFRSFSPREAHDISRASKSNLTKSLHVFCRGPVCQFCDSPHVVRARSEHAGGAWQQNQTEPKSQLSRTTCGESQILDLFHRGRRMTSPASKPNLT